MTRARVKLRRLVEFLADGPLEPEVPGQPEHIECPVMFLAEGHQGIATEA